MTHEQQVQLKLLKEQLPKTLKSSIKQYNFKKIDGTVWVQKDGVFCQLLLIIAERNGRFFLLSEERIKPLWIDELLWDILGMESNKNAPLSLRANGAFTVSGMTCFEDEYELVERDLPELEKRVNQYLKHFDKTVKNCGEATYYTLFNPSAYQSELQAILILIHERMYAGAIAKIKSLKSYGDYFRVNGKGFKEYAEEYCRNRLN